MFCENSAGTKHISGHMPAGQRATLLKGLGHLPEDTRGIATEFIDSRKPRCFPAYFSITARYYRVVHKTLSRRHAHKRRK